MVQLTSQLTFSYIDVTDKSPDQIGAGRGVRQQKESLRPFSCSSEQDQLMSFLTDVYSSTIFLNTP